MMTVSNYKNMSKGAYLFYIMLHPVSGFSELKYNKKGSVSISLVLLGLWFLAVIYTRKGTDFAFNYFNTEEVNVFGVFTTTLFLFALAVVSNIAFSTLMDGTGTFRDIWIGGAYSLLPTIFVLFLCTLLSNIFVVEEGAYLTQIKNVGYIWSIIVALAAIYELHDYSFKETLKICFLTILGMAIMLFLIMLIYSLYQQVSGFIGTLFFEIRYKLIS